MTVEQALVASDLGQIMQEARETMERAAAEIQRLRAVNAEMLAALKYITRVANHPGTKDPFDDGWRWFYGCQDAIAHAEASA